MDLIEENKGRVSRMREVQKLVGCEKGILLGEGCTPQQDNNTGEHEVNAGSAW